VHATASEYFDKNPQDLCSNGLGIILDSCLSFWFCEQLIQVLPRVYSSSARLVPGRRTTVVTENKSDRLNAIFTQLAQLKAEGTDLSEAVDWAVYYDWEIFCDWLFVHHFEGNIRGRSAERLRQAIVYPSPRTAKALAVAPYVDANSLLRTLNLTTLIFEVGVHGTFATGLEILLARPHVDVRRVNARRPDDQRLVHQVARDKRCASHEGPPSTSGYGRRRYSRV